MIEQVPAEEADILSKLLAEVASASEPNLLQVGDFNSKCGGAILLIFFGVISKLGNKQG